MMRKAAVPKIEFEYEDSKDNEEVVQKMYNRIFDLAKRNVLEKRKLSRESQKQNKILQIIKLDIENISVNH